MSATQEARPTTLESGRGRLTLGGWAGVAGPALFAATWVAQEVARIGDFDPMSAPVSALAAGPSGWIQNANFIVFGLLTLVFAVALMRAMGRARGWVGRIGPMMFALTALSAGGAVAFPVYEDASGALVIPVAHSITGILFFGGNALAIVATSVAALAVPAWRKWSAVTLTLGALMILSVPIQALFFTPGAPWDEWAGLFQRIIVLGLLFPARIVISLRVLRDSRPRS